MGMGELKFNIGKLAAGTGAILEQNAMNVIRKKEFLKYIDDVLSKAWNTEHGQQAIQELRSFVENQFQDYIDYLNERVQKFENTAVLLNRINHL